MEDKIKKYTGENIATTLEGLARETYIACASYMHEAFGDNVEYERMLYHVLLCEDTKEYLYGKPPGPVRYVPGSRPVLEKIVAEVTEGCETQRDKVLAILVYIRDLYKKVNGEDYFYGGTEEELIKKSEWYCERVARLMCGLCEIAGMPGRVVFHIAAGHLTSEIYLEDHWAYFDPRCGMFCLDEDGKFMSVQDILDNREMIFKQNEWVCSFHSPYWSLDFRQHRNYHFCFNPRELQCIGDYSLMDADKYHFEWRRSHENKFASGDRTIHTRYTELGLMYLIQ